MENKELIESEIMTGFKIKRENEASHFEDTLERMKNNCDKRIETIIKEMFGNGK